MTINHEGYHRFFDPSTQKHTGSFEVFYRDAEDYSTGETICEPGWYWWACFPDCLPDSDPIGPFESAEGAYNNARNL